MIIEKDIAPMLWQLTLIVFSLIKLFYSARILFVSFSSKLSAFLILISAPPPPPLNSFLSSSSVLAVSF